MCGSQRSFFNASLVDAFCFFSREGAEDRLYATDRSGVGPEERFFLKLSQKDEAMRNGRNGSWARVGGKILDSSMQRESYILDQRSGLSTLN